MPDEEIPRRLLTLNLERVQATIQPESTPEDNGLRDDTEENL